MELVLQFLVTVSRFHLDSFLCIFDSCVCFEGITERYEMTLIFSLHSCIIFHILRVIALNQSSNSFMTWSLKPFVVVFVFLF